MDKFFDGYTVGIEVIRHQRSSFQEGGEGYIIYYKILNQTEKKLKANVDGICIINNNAQFDKDYWLTGFAVTETPIMAGAFKTAGAIFLESVSGIINKGCKTSIIINDYTNGYNYDAIFILGNDNRWQLLSCEVEEQEKIPHKRSVQSKLKKSIERLEVFEEKLGVELENISIKIDNAYNSITIIGEILSSTGDSINQDIRINVNLYNDDNEIIANKNTYFLKKDFMGYDTFELSFYEDKIALNTTKTRIYVTKY